MPSAEYTGTGEDAELPEHYCSECVTVLYRGEPSCPECGRRRPSSGWSRLREAHDRFLGCLIDDRYFVEKRESRGVRSSVYRAVIDDELEVALKVAPTFDCTSMDEYVRERMAPEVRAVGRLESEHIVPILEFHELDDGPPVIVMEYLDGVTLDEVVHREGISVERALEIISQIARGLAEAHDRQLVHRDVKPSNIMLESQGTEQETALLLDFGIVRMHQAATHRSQEFVGTPLYTSPEQARLDEIGHHTDIYSLGATLFFVLTGRPPFAEEDVDNVMRAHVDEEPPRLSEAGPLLEFSEGLEELVGEMLSKFPEQRPDAEEVVERLERLGEDEARDREEGIISVPPAEEERPRSNPDPRDTLIYPPEEGAQSSVVVSATPTSSRDSVSEGEGISQSETARYAPDGENGEDEAGRRLTFESSFSFIAETGQGEDFTVRPGTDPDRDVSSLASLSESTDVQDGFANAVCFDASPDEDVLLVDQQHTVWLLERDADEARSLFQSADAIASVSVGSRSVWVGERHGRCLRLSRDESLVEDAVEFPGDLRVASMAATDWGDAMVVAFDNGELYAGSSRPVRRENLHSGVPNPVAAAAQPEGESYCVASSSGEVMVFELTAGELSGERFQLETAVVDLDISTSGELLAVATAGGTIAVYHSAIGEPVTSVDELGVSPSSIFFTRDDELRAIGFRDGELLLWDCVRDTEIADLSRRERSRADEL